MHPMFSFLNIVFKHPVELMNLFTQISILNASYYLVILLPYYLFRLYTAIIGCLLFLHSIAKLRIACERDASRLK
jgi:hypothetical protein